MFFLCARDEGLLAQQCARVEGLLAQTCYIYIYNYIPKKKKMEPGERDPLMPHAEDNNDDDDRANAAQKLQPEASSTHVPSGEQTEMTTMKKTSKARGHASQITLSLKK